VAHCASDPQVRWQGVSDEHTGLYVRSEQRSPTGRDGGRAKVRHLFRLRP